LWGTRDRLNQLFEGVSDIACTERAYVFRYPSPEQWLEMWRRVYGPLQKAFDTLDADAQSGLSRDLIALINTHNRADDGTVVVSSAYLEVIVAK